MSGVGAILCKIDKVSFFVKMIFEQSPEVCEETRCADIKGKCAKQEEQEGQKPRVLSEFKKQQGSQVLLEHYKQRGSGMNEVKKAVEPDHVDPHRSLQEL